MLIVPALPLMLEILLVDHLLTTQPRLKAVKRLTNTILPAPTCLRQAGVTVQDWLTIHTGEVWWFSMLNTHTRLGQWCRTGLVTY
jgi:hypothetical protein